MPELTVLVVTENNLPALKLSVESLRRQNTDARFHLWIWDNKSTDGVREWAKDNCDRLFLSENYLNCNDHRHGVALDKMVQEVTTPYLITMDNDVLHRGPSVTRLLTELKAADAFCAFPSARHSMGEVEYRGVMLKGQPRIDPYFAAFKTKAIAQLSKHVSFTPYESVGCQRFHDTGGMIFQAAEGCGLKSLDLSWIRSSVKHYGSMTWAMYAPDGSHTKDVYTARRERVGNDLREFEDSLRDDTEVVIARYKENLDWVSALEPFKITVYDKSGVPWADHVLLPNVGREAHTYAHHVAQHYGSLAEVTAFVQGDPFPHAPMFLAELRVPTCYFKAYGSVRLKTTPESDSCHPGLPLGRTYKELTGEVMPPEVWFAPGACFAAHRSVLQRYPQKWWVDLTKRLADKDTQSWYPWTIERLWASLLTRVP